MQIEVVIFFFVTILCMLLNFMNRGKGEYQMDYVPAPRITEADKNNDTKYESDQFPLFSISIFGIV